MRRYLWILWFLAGCQGIPEKLPVGSDFPSTASTDSGEPAGTPGAPAPYDPAPPGRLARRAHLDLLGTLPSAEVVRAAETDLDATLDAILASDGLEEGMVDFFDRVWSMRLDSQDFIPAEVADPDRVAWARMVGEEPLRLAARGETLAERGGGEHVGPRESFLLFSKKPVNGELR